MAASWYYKKGKQSFGPVSEQELKRLAECGQLTSADLVCKDGMNTFVPASRVRGLFPNVPLQQMAPVQPGPVVAKPLQSPLQGRSISISPKVLIIGIILLSIGVFGYWIAFHRADSQSETTNICASNITVAESPHYGKVIITVSWKYNDYVGNKPDTDAIVMLLPHPLKNKIKQMPSTFFRKCIPDEADELEKCGAYMVYAGGDGRAVFNRVIAGEYTMIIISKNTEDLADTWEISQKILSRYFDGDIKIYNKMHIGEIDVYSGDTVEYSHDFGYTRF